MRVKASDFPSLDTAMREGTACFVRESSTGFRTASSGR